MAHQAPPIWVQFRIQNGSFEKDLCRLQVPPQEVALQIKHRIQSFMGIPVEQYQLACRGLVLQDHFTLLGLPSETVVYVQPSASFPPQLLGSSGGSKSRFDPTRSQPGISPDSAATIPRRKSGGGGPPLASSDPIRSSALTSSSGGVVGGPSGPRVVSAYDLPHLLHTSPAALDFTQQFEQRRPPRISVPTSMGVGGDDSAEPSSPRGQQGIAEKKHRRSRTREGAAQSRVGPAPSASSSSAVASAAPGGGRKSSFAPRSTGETPSQADARRCRVDGISGGFVGEEMTAGIVAANASGTQLVSGGDRVSLHFEGPETVKAKVVDQQNGTYVATYLIRFSGMYWAFVRVNGAEVAGSPFTVIFKPARQSDASKCTVTGPGVHSPALGAPTAFYIEGKDTFGNPSESSKDQFVVSVEAAGANITPRIISQGNGTYVVSYVPTVPGPYKITVMLGVQHVAGSPFAAFVAAKMDPSKIIAEGPALLNGVAGYANTVDLKTFDVAGNAMASGGASFKIELRGPGTWRARIADNRDGTYTIAYQVSSDGQYYLSIFHQNRHIKGSPFTVSISPSEDDGSEDVGPPESPVPSPRALPPKPGGPPSGMTSSGTVVHRTSTANPAVPPRRTSSHTPSSSAISSAKSWMSDQQAAHVPSPAASAPSLGAPPAIRPRNSRSNPTLQRPPFSRPNSSSSKTAPSVPHRGSSRTGTGPPGKPGGTPLPPIQMSTSGAPLTSFSSPRFRDLTFLRSPAPAPPVSANNLSSIIRLQTYVRAWLAREDLRLLRFAALTSNEILQTERVYLTHLQMVKTDFREPLERLATQTKGIDDGKLPIIFSNLDFLISVSNDLITQLVPCFAFPSPDVPAIARVFANMAPTLRYTYTRYINNYDQSLKTLQWATANSPEFTRFLEQQQEAKTLSLSAFLIMPVQRLPKYELLLREMLKYTPPHFDGHELLEEALAAINEVVSFINERKRSVENLSKLVDTIDLVSGVPEGLFSLTKERKFLADSPLTIRTLKKGKTGKDKIRQFIVFSDILLVCKKNPFQGKGGKIYKLDTHIFLKDAMIDIPEHETTIKLILSSGMFTILLSDEKERSQWKTIFQGTHASFH